MVDSRTLTIGECETRRPLLYGSLKVRRGEERQRGREGGREGGREREREREREGGRDM